MDMQRKGLSYQLMVEASPIAIVLVDMYGKIDYVNNSTEKLFLFDKSELIGKDITVLLPERFHVAYFAFFRNILNDPQIRRLGVNDELFALRKDKSEFPVEINLTTIETDDGSSVLLAINDITETARVHEEFKFIVESAPNAIVLVDELGEIVMLNKQAEVLFGYERTELLGRKVETLVPINRQASHPKLRKDFSDKPNARPMGAGRDLFALTKQGGEIPIEIGLNPIKRGEKQFVLASIIDITQRKRSEEAFRLYTKKIEEKNEELEQFAYIASHDLKEPLNTITNIINIIADDEGFSPSKELTKMLGYLEKTTDRMRELISGLLDLSRLGQRAELKNVNLNELVQSVIQDLDSSIKRTSSTIELAPLPTLNVYSVELRLLFQNLISNAIKYCPQEVKPVVQISAKFVNQNWQFLVKDNGIGIPTQHKEKVFLLFQRLHSREAYEGIGIGLAHCKKIVELHNGSIWVESEVGKGSEFYFSIPML